ncbi:MAG: glycosyltransferase [Oscillospiraceae bacterium]|nr:glycosyltransferase [Oscillospiraceae bacterium]
MDSKLVSVIIPAYNTEAYLPLCMETVLGQTWRELEILLVDDGSGAECAALCDEYAARDPRVRVIHKKNGGAAAARNTALDVMRGDYVTFVDSDDFAFPDMVEYLLALAEREQADIVSAEGIYTRDRRILPVEQPPEQIRTQTGREALVRVDAWKSQIWPKIYRREVFESVRFPEGMIYEDDAITAQLLYDCRKIVLSNRKCYYYYLSDNSVMRAPFSKKRFDMLRVYELREEFYREKKEPELLEMNELYWYIQIYRLRCDMKLARWPEREAYLPMLADMEKQLSHVPQSRYYTPSRRIKKLVLQYFPRFAGAYYRRKDLKRLES